MQHYKHLRVCVGVHAFINIGSCVYVFYTVHACIRYSTCEVAHTHMTSQRIMSNSPAFMYVSLQDLVTYFTLYVQYICMYIVNDIQV